MKAVVAKIIAGIMAILFVDILGSVFSNRLDFNYSLLFPITLLIYTVVGLFVAKNSNRQTVVISTAILGLFDATVGWWVSILFQANTGDLNTELTITNIIGTIIFMTLFASAFGLLVSWIANYNTPNNKKYQSLDNTLVTFSSILAMRLVLGFILGMGLIVTVSNFLACQDLLTTLVLTSVILIFSYFISSFSSIIYNQDEIIVQNVKGKYAFTKDEFSGIRPWKSFISIYFVDFKDGSSFLFGPNRLSIGIDADKKALEIQEKLIKKARV